MPVVDADGTPIHVEVEGPAGAPVLMFSNSLGTDLHMWDDQVKALSGSYRIVRYDQRGHGKSGAPAGAYSMERLSRDVLTILDALEIPRTHFCGLSMGAMTGMWLGRFAPERIDKLVLANTTAKSQTPENWNARIQTVNAKGIEGIADAVLGVWFTKEFREREPSIVARMRAMMVSHDPRGYVGCCAGIRDMDQRWGVADIKAPTLIIAGRQDSAAHVSASEFLKEKIAGSRLELLDTGHLSNVEQSEAFSGLLKSFLER